MGGIVGILCAVELELTPFLPHIRDCVITERAMLRIHRGRMEGVEVAAVFSGVCKVNAAVAAQLLIDRYSAEMIINAGTAGAMSEELELLDTVISTEAAYHDVAGGILTEYHPWMESVCFQADPALLELSRKAVSKLTPAPRVAFGRMVTGEAFITDAGREEINRDFAPLSVDMETGSVAHVCYVNKIPFIAIRTVTDTPKHRGEENFAVNCGRASEISKDITLALLRELAEISQKQEGGV